MKTQKFIALKPSEDKDSTRFYPQELEDCNKFDLMASVLKDEMIAIVDCNSGGIIGYAIGERNADMMWMALEQAIDPELEKDNIIRVNDAKIEQYSTVNSSLGYVCFNSDNGHVITDHHSNNELDNIDCFDVAEYTKFYNTTIIPANIDILDIGYWLKDETYKHPCADWREEVAYLRAGNDPADLLVLEILSRKKQGIDCTEEESAELKMWVKKTVICIATGQNDIISDIQNLFPLEYVEALDKVEIDSP